MIIKVEQKHINEAKEGDWNCSNCPVALAIKEIINKEVFVYICTIVVENKQYLLPQQVSNWIRRFDMGEAALPFEFDLGIVC